MRTILHVDLDAFYASVEVLDNPALAGKPVLVGGTGARGVVAAASYEARRFGVHSAMPMGQARRLCPQAVVLPPRFEVYGAKSRAVHEIFAAFTPVIEPIALDEAFLDVTGGGRLLGTGAQIGAAVRARIRAETGLTASVGVATSKLLAKLASDDAKPDGMLVVEPGTELAFLHPHPVARLWGVGPATLARLARFGVETIGDLAAVAEASLVDALGRAHGGQLHALAQGRDDRPVEADRETKSIGQEETFPRDVADREVLRREALRMAERVGSRLREHGLAGRTVTLKVRFPDFRTITRSATLPDPFSVSGEIARLALGLLEKVDTAGGIRLLGVTVSNLTALAARQESLFGDDGQPSSAPAGQIHLQSAVDAVRARFGPDALGSAALVEPGAGVRVRRQGTPCGPEEQPP
ncbi:MAG: polymerase [Actinomycetota bacterium]|nr:polymerase [Actinomycetota bacterium]